MLLIGVNRSPYTRRVAITLKAYGLPYEQNDLSGFGNRAEVRSAPRKLHGGGARPSCCPQPIRPDAHSPY